MVRAAAQGGEGPRRRWGLRGLLEPQTRWPRAPPRPAHSRGPAPVPGLASLHGATAPPAGGRALRRSQLGREPRPGDAESPEVTSPPRARLLVCKMDTDSPALLSRPREHPQGSGPGLPGQSAPMWWARSASACAAWPGAGTPRSEATEPGFLLSVTIFKFNHFEQRLLASTFHWAPQITSWFCV